ncbi:MAG: SWIM zinc finger family protein [Planctomycetota bacterium]
MNTVPFTYRYPFQSGFRNGRSGAELDTATFDPRALSPHLFQGRVLSPRPFAQMLLLLSKVVRTHFHLHLPPDYLDPVITASPEMLRLEAFSACCGVYARADLPLGAFNGKTIRDGTTNVDFGPAMQSALTRIGETDDVTWRVGSDEVELSTARETVIERKVGLPARWIKCFTEVHAIQQRLRPRVKLNRDNAVRLFKLLPKGKSPKRPLYITSSNDRVNVSTRVSTQGVALTGVHRLSVAEPLIRRCQWVRAWSEEAGNTAWEIHGPAGRLFLLHSPQPYRAFSGEGQKLIDFVSSPWQISENGFDVVEQSEFDRTLPFDLSGLERMQSRLKSARRLITSGGVTRVPDKEHEFEVRRDHSTQYVRIVNDQGICSCKWYARHKDERGPCKHVLAAILFQQSQTQRSHTQ